METINHRIFIVEDDLFYGQIMETFLRDQGYPDCHQFNDASSCLAQLSALKPDIIFLDYYLGSDNGNELLKKIMTALPETRVVMVSAQEYVNISLRSMQLGAYEYLEKNSQTLRNMLGVIQQIDQDIANKVTRKNLYSRNS